MPQAATQESVTQQLCALERGESYAKVRRIDGKKIDLNLLVELEDQLSSNVSHAVLRAAQKSGFSFSTEKGRSFTRSGAILLTLAITRLG